MTIHKIFSSLPTVSELAESCVSSPTVDMETKTIDRAERVVLLWKNRDDHRVPPHRVKSIQRKVGVIHMLTQGVASVVLVSALWIMLSVVAYMTSTGTDIFNQSMGWAQQQAQQHLGVGEEGLVKTAVVGMVASFVAGFGLLVARVGLCAQAPLLHLSDAKDIRKELIKAKDHPQIAVYLPIIEEALDNEMNEKWQYTSEFWQEMRGYLKELAGQDEVAVQ